MWSGENKTDYMLLPYKPLEFGNTLPVLSQFCNVQGYSCFVVVVVVSSPSVNYAGLITFCLCNL